jgi:hypothetical protein
VAIAPNGTTYAIEYTDTGPDPDVGAIELHRHTGAAIPGGDDSIACDFPVGPNPKRVTFSNDSTKIAWKDDGGIKVATVPDLTAPGASCPSPTPHVVISATGEFPALGGIDVPALIASRQPAGGGNNPPAGGGNNPPTGGNPPVTGNPPITGNPPGGGDRVAPGLGFGTVKQAKLASALKTGVAFKITPTEACTLDVDLLLPAKVAKKLKLKRAIGSSAARLKAGANTVKVKASKAAQKKLKKQKSLKLSLSGTCEDAAGNATRINRSVTLKK